MTTLTVWKFDDLAEAERTARRLNEMQRQGLLVIHDAAVVSWPRDQKRPTTRQAHDVVGSAALHGTFWGLLFGLLFFVPLIGAAVGAAAGALGGSLTDVGIHDDFIREVRAQVTPGTSALFLLTSREVADRVLEAFEGSRPHLVHTNLSREQEERLRAAFGGEAPRAPTPV